MGGREKKKRGKGEKIIKGEEEEEEVYDISGLSEDD